MLIFELCFAHNLAGGLLYHQHPVILESDVVADLPEQTPCWCRSPLEQFEQAHIPGAVFIDHRNSFATAGGGK